VEVKYTVSENGFVDELSKTVQNALGEAVGINLVSGKDKARLIECLDACDEQDYFERGIELAIERFGVEFLPVDISDLFAVEIDFEADLSRVNDARL
jgi:choline kinase